MGITSFAQAEPRKLSHKTKAVHKRHLSGWCGSGLCMVDSITVNTIVARGATESLFPYFPGQDNFCP